MPVYDYKCDECGNRFERRQSFSDDPISVCPKCGGHTRRVIHAPGIVFKGSGFYKTDSRGSSAASEGSEATADTDAKPAEKSEDSAGESTEAKPAAEPAPATT